MFDQDPWGMETATPLAILLAVIITILLVLAAVFPVHGATTIKHNNSLGAVQYQNNPNTYKVGHIVSGANVDGNLNVRLQPLATYGLFTEEILLCGMPIDKFPENGAAPVVLTYRTQASRLVQGVGCHALVRVDEMKMEALTK